jgi:hypothetical protein
MKPDVVFSIGNLLALSGWLALIFAARVRYVPNVLCKYLLPGSIAVLYTFVLVTHWSEHQGGFGSLSAVLLLFTNRWILTAAWLHYLAFDLFIGAWEVREAQRAGMSLLWTVPCLMGTYLFGPAGLLLFLLLKRSLGRQTVVVVM